MKVACYAHGSLSNKNLKLSYLKFRSAPTQCWGRNENFRLITYCLSISLWVDTGSHCHS